MVIVFMFTALPAWRAGRVSTLRALTSGVAPEGSRPSLTARVAARLRLPPLLVIAIKDAFSRPMRAALTIAALTLAVMTVTFALAIDATLVAARDDRGLLGGAPFELQVVPRTMSNDDTEALIAARPEVAQYVKRSWFEVDIPERYQHLGTWGLAGDYETIGYRIEDGRMFSGPDEAVLGLGLARDLDLAVGDDVTFTLAGQGFRLPVVGTYVEDSNSGKRIIFHVATVEEAIPNPRFVTFGVKLDPGSDAATVRQSLLQEGDGAIDVDDLEQDWKEGMQDARAEVRTILFSLNGVLLAIAAVNLLTTLLFTVRERQRDVGILKSIGLTPFQVVGSFVMGSVVFALVAAAIGIPAGTFATGVLFDFAGSKDGWPKGIAETPGVGWLALTVLLAVAVTVIGSALPAIRAGRSRIIDALRYE
jgi:putative ABC transport system permease protein